jgi:hypothetical protein
MKCVNCSREAKVVVSVGYPERLPLKKNDHSQVYTIPEDEEWPLCHSCKLNLNFRPPEPRTTRGSGVKPRKTCSSFTKGGHKCRHNPKKDSLNCGQHSTDCHPIKKRKTTPNHI